MPVLFLSSCIRYKDMAYLQDTEFLKPYENYRTEVYKIKPYDNLIIKVTSFDEELSQLVNQNQAKISLTDPKGLLYFSSYTVNEEGYIDLPMAGKVLAREKTLTEISEAIALKLTDFVKDPTVNVKLSNYQVTVLGEVSDPGVKYYYDTKLTVFQAIGMAKDLTPFGNRKKVKLIRETETGTMIVPLDLTRPDLMESDYYFLQPDDLVYIEPVKARTFQLNKANVELITGVLTLGLLIYSVVPSN